MPRAIALLGSLAGLGSMAGVSAQNIYPCYYNFKNSSYNLQPYQAPQKTGAWRPHAACCSAPRRAADAHPHAATLPPSP